MNKRWQKVCSFVVVCAMLICSIYLPNDGVVVSAEEGIHAVKRDLKNVVEVVFDDNGTNRIPMNLYKNGVYEVGRKLSTGEHTYQVYVNGEKFGEKQRVLLESEKEVFVRLQKNEVYDSVNHGTGENRKFHTATWVGNFNGFTFLNEEKDTYTIESWKPQDEKGTLSYVGGGIYCERFQFKAFDEDHSLPDGGYKVAFDGAWSYSLGDGDGNIGLTIPAGTDHITIFVDEINQVVYDSIRTKEYNVYQNAGTVTYPAFEMNVSLIGTVRGTEGKDWDVKEPGYEFRQVDDKLFLYQTVLSKGTYQYKVVMNYKNWYDKGGNKSLRIENDSRLVTFLYDAESEGLYDSINDGNNIAALLGLEVEKAVSKVAVNPNGTVKFITVEAKESDDVSLCYAVKKDDLEFTTVPMKKGYDADHNFNGSFVSDDIFFGDKEAEIVYYYLVNGEKVLDSSQTTEVVGGVSYSLYHKASFGGRLVTVPGTFPGPSWDAASNVMEYMGDGLYSYTFENVQAGNFQFKIATGTWNENYGKDGVPGGENYTVTVPSKQDVTVYYNDLTTHLAVTSLFYEFVDIKLVGDGISATLEDKGLTGVYKAVVPMKAGVYSNLVLKYNGKVLSIYPINLAEDKNVTFYFDSYTKLYYNDSAMVETNKDAVKFDSKDSTYKSVYGAVEEGETVRFSIDTGNDVTKALLFTRGNELKTYDMKAEKKGDSTTWSTDAVFDSYGRYTYFFALYYGSYVQVYCDDDGYYGTGVLTNLSELKPYDLVVYKKGYETPEWMKNAVIYQIFPDRFFNGDMANDEAQVTSRGDTDYEFIKDWYMLPENPEQIELNPDLYPENAHKGDLHWNNEIYGGDLKGIVERIDYLKALGVNVIYLNPIFSSISSHRYDATDYKKIDPILGDLGDFKELVKVAEANDMHIVLDGVFNHVSDDSIYFDRYYKFVGQEHKVGAYPYWAYVYDYMDENKGATLDVAKAAAESYFRTKGVTDFSYTEWFQVNPTTMVDDKKEPVVDSIGERKGKPVYSYEGWWGYDSMPVILSTNGSEYQTGNWAEQVIDGKDSVTKYWINQGSDGWRLDVANEVSDETWQHFRESVKGLNSEAVIIGEIWDDATEYILGDMYDSVMNYVFRNAMLAFAKGGDATESVKTLEKLRERYPKEAFYAMMNLVGSHDTARLLSYLDGVDDDRNQKDIDSAFPSYEKTSEVAKQRQYLVAFLQMTYPGAPTIYYGDELGLTGADDPDDRRGMPWGKGSKELVEWYAKVANLRSKYSALRTGSVEPMELGNENIMGYVRADEEASLIVLANNAGHEVECVVQLEKDVTDVLSGVKYASKDGKVVVSVPAYRGVVLSDVVKELDVNLEGLKPGYDKDYEVVEEQTTPAPTVSAMPETTESVEPTVVPTVEPTVKPTVKPTKKPTPKPTKKPTPKPSKKPTPKPSKKPVVKTPVIKVEVVKKKGAAIISWKKDSSVDKYEITYSKDKNFSKGVKKVVTTNKTQKTIKGFKKDTTYYIRVRSCKKVGKKTYYSKFSAVKKAKF